MQFHHEVACKAKKMKKSLMHLTSALFVVSLIFFTTCKTDDPKPGGEWSDEDKESYNQVLNVQDWIAQNLNGWFQTMDSLDAINEAYQSFRNSEIVSSATINSQGIAVQYANGIRGGIFLNPMDEGIEKSSELLLNGLDDDNSVRLKSVINQRKMILINPHYDERKYYTDQIYPISQSNLNRVGIDLSAIYKNAEATVDRFTELSGYGIIQIYSHGMAYPKDTDIEEVFLLTGETVNNNTSKKYWNELKSGDIPILVIGSHDHKYWVSKDFITKHNDFSNDTVMFFGGFCYSFLDEWPDLADSFAYGAYLGFDWSVLTYFNANMSVNSIALMSDTSKSQPMDLEAWMNDPELEKSFWHSVDNRKVNILYAGDGDITLWGKVSVKIIPQSSDGTPVSKAGEAGVAYPFKCEVSSGIGDLEFIWGIGNGNPPYTLSNAVNITWNEEGNYMLKVGVKNKNNGNIIGSAKINVTIGDAGEEELIDILKKQNYVYLGFGPETAFIWDTISSPVTKRDYGDLEWDSMPIVWDGFNFSGTAKTYDGQETHFINGSVGSDGSTVSVVAEKEGFIMGADFTIKLSVDNYPVELPLDATGVMYRVESNLIQNYVTGFEGRFYWSDNGHVVNYTGVKWDEIENLYIRFIWGAEAPKSACVDM